METRKCAECGRDEDPRFMVRHMGKLVCAPVMDKRGLFHYCRRRK